MFVQPDWAAAPTQSMATAARTRAASILLSAIDTANVSLSLSLSTNKPMLWECLSSSKKVCLLDCWGDLGRGDLCRGKLEEETRERGPYVGDQTRPRTCLTICLRKRSNVKPGEWRQGNVGGCFCRWPKLISNYIPAAYLIWVGLFSRECSKAETLRSLPIEESITCPWLHLSLQLWCCVQLLLLESMDILAKKRLNGTLNGRGMLAG